VSDGQIFFRRERFLFYLCHLGGKVCDIMGAVAIYQALHLIMLRGGCNRCLCVSKQDSQIFHKGYLLLSDAPDIFTPYKMLVKFIIFSLHVMSLRGGLTHLNGIVAP
jgi:hypothetical protein